MPTRWKHRHWGAVYFPTGYGAISPGAREAGVQVAEKACIVRVNPGKVLSDEKIGDNVDIDDDHSRPARLA